VSEEPKFWLEPLPDITAYEAIQIMMTLLVVLQGGSATTKIRVAQHHVEKLPVRLRRHFKAADCRSVLSRQ